MAQGLVSFKNTFFLPNELTYLPISAWPIKPLQKEPCATRMVRPEGWIWTFSGQMGSDAEVHCGLTTRRLCLWLSVPGVIVLSPFPPALRSIKLLQLPPTSLVYTDYAQLSALIAVCVLFVGVCVAARGHPVMVPKPPGTNCSTLSAGKVVMKVWTYIYKFPEFSRSFIFQLLHWSLFA